MNILFVSPEVFPFARAGGLGDVSHQLPRSLTKLGHKLTVITPRYRGTEDSGYPLSVRGDEIQVPMSWREKTATLFSTFDNDGVEIIFIGCDELYDRAGLYGNEFGDYEDNAERYHLFHPRRHRDRSSELGLRPDLIHCHDWPSGLLPFYTKNPLSPTCPTCLATGGFSVFTFHNLGSQGTFLALRLRHDRPGMGVMFTPEGVEFHGRLNMTKAGLVAADLITTVSRQAMPRKYLTPEFAFGLEGVMQSERRDRHLLSVLNGVDYSVWDPAADPEHIGQLFGPDDLENKGRCRADLARAFEPSNGSYDRPIVAVDFADSWTARGSIIIERGHGPDPRLWTVKMVFMGHGRGQISYSAWTELARAADPDQVGRHGRIRQGNGPSDHRRGGHFSHAVSRYEPCGLEQLYGLKYGAVPRGARHRRPGRYRRSTFWTEHPETREPGSNSPTTRPMP